MSETNAYTLIKAAFESLELMEELLKTNPALLEARTGLHETPLHYLAVEDHLQAVRRLINAGAAVNTLNSCGATPLSEAASLGYTDMVESLLSAGAQLSVIGQSEPVLIEATRSGCHGVVQLLLSAGAPIDEQNDIREAPIHIAAGSDERLEILELLLAHGANCNLKRIFDETPLDVAVENGATKCAEVLKRHGGLRGSTNSQ